MSMIETVRNTLQVFTSRLSVRRDNDPINSVSALEYFVATRASFVSQKSLYGYLKTRMGTRYPSMFEDDVFVHSINIAKAHIFAACLADLTIFAVAHAFSTDKDDTVRRSAALKCYAHALAENADQLPDEFSVADSTGEFTARLGTTAWSDAALTRENFIDSPRALFDWAPIAPELKKNDHEIVRNSINFAFHEVRQNFTKRLDAGSIQTDLRGQA
jgi:hypothetical protein